MFEKKINKMLKKIFIYIFGKFFKKLQKNFPIEKISQVRNFFFNFQSKKKNSYDPIRVSDCLPSVSILKR